MIGTSIARVASALKVVRRRSALYRRHFGFLQGWGLALRDRPGASGIMAVHYRNYPPLRVRRGDTDLRTLCHVLCDSGYESPWPPLESPRWIIDAGANSGMAAVYFAALHPAATVIALEPDPANFALLEANTSSYPNVRCVQAALWTHRGRVDLVDPGQGSWAFRVSEESAQPSSSTSVAATTIGDLLHDYEIDRISILKVDIEGGEKAVFDDSSDWIERVDAIAIELHDRFQPGCSEVFDRATRGFSLRDTRGEDTFVAR